MDCTSPRVVTARKRHRCDYCSRHIEVGSQYEVVTVFGDYPYKWKSHMECSFLVSRYKNWCYNGGDGITSESFRDDVRYYWHIHHYNGVGPVPSWDMMFSDMLSDIIEKNGKNVTVEAKIGDTLTDLTEIAVDILKIMRVSTVTIRINGVDVIVNKFSTTDSINKGHLRSLLSSNTKK